MNEITKQELVHLMLKKTRETFEEAELLATKEHWNTTINRLYYCSFYAVKAFLICSEKDTNTHQATKNALHYQLIKTGLLEVSFGKFYNRLFDLRNEADYSILTEISEKTVNVFFPVVIDFINKIEKIIATNRDCVDG